MPRMLVVSCLLLLAVVACDETPREQSPPAFPSVRASKSGDGLVPAALPSPQKWPQPKSRDANRDPPTCRRVSQTEREQLAQELIRFEDLSQAGAFLEVELCDVPAGKGLKWKGPDHSSRCLVKKEGGAWADAKGRVASSNIRARPVDPFIAVTSGFGVRNHPLLEGRRSHLGTDYATPIGANAYAVRDGKVLSVATSDASGLTLTIRHPDSGTSVYRHLQKALVSKGQAVRVGQVVAHTGASGEVTGPHLHFEYLVGAVAVDWRVAGKEFPVLPRDERAWCKRAAALLSCP